MSAEREEEGAPCRPWAHHPPTRQPLSWAQEVLPQSITLVLPQALPQHYPATRKLAAPEQAQEALLQGTAGI